MTGPGPLSVDPNTGAVWDRHRWQTLDEVEAAVAGCAAAAATWGRVPVGERTAGLAAVAAALRARRDDLARLLTAEMGKRTVEGLAEVDKCALVCDHYAATAADGLAPRRTHADVLVRHDPLGPLLAVMPWNYPLWQVFRFAAPQLAAGNTVLLKHAPNVTGCSRAIEALVADATGWDGLVVSLVIEDATTAEVIRDDRVRGVTVTGSPRAGAAVASVAGSVLKKSVLELGGSDPFLVLPDADLDGAVRAAATSRLLNAGQTCIAAKRFLVHRDVHDEFLEALTAIFAAVTVGDPADPSVDLGPLARDDLRAAIDDQVRRSLAAGARVTTGGSPVAGPGYAYAPTVLATPHGDVAAMHEETFGPVATVLAFDDLDRAVALANDTEYGLGAAVWTADEDLAEDVAARLDVGVVAVNDLVRSDPRVPFGGVKRSGYGRELGIEGLREFTNVKAVVTAPRTR